LEQGGHGGRYGAAGPGGDGNAGTADFLRVPGRRAADHPGERAGGAERRAAVGEDGRRPDGSGGHVHPDAGTGGRQAVHHADRGYFLDSGTGHGGDGTHRARDLQGWRGNGDRRIPADAQDGGHGRGNVQEAIGRRARRGQRGVAVARGGKDGSGARAGDRQAGVDHAAHAVQGRSIRIEQGRGGAAHAVLQGIPAAVLLPDDGRDGGGGAAGRHRDGDAGRQRKPDGGADNAGGHGQGLALRDTRG